MSFDLYFCGMPDAQLDLEAVRACLMSFGHVDESRSDDGTLVQFDYSNDVTGVYCLFDVVTSPDGDNELQLPDPYRGVGFSVSINFLRPHFFALEVMPIITCVARTLDLSPYDPQEEQVYPPGVAAETLIQNWIDHNERATRMMALDAESPIRKPYLSREQAHYWWQYTGGREGFQESLEEDVFVPSILPMVDSANQVKLTVIWPAEISADQRRVPLPQVFPACDYVLLAWQDAGSRMKTSIVPYPVVESALAGLLEAIDGPVGGLKVLRPRYQAQACSIYEQLPAAEFTGLNHIAPDGFVDVLT